MKRRATGTKGGGEIGGGGQRRGEEEPRRQKGGKEVRSLAAWGRPAGVCLGGLVKLEKRDNLGKIDRWLRLSQRRHLTGKEAHPEEGETNPQNTRKKKQKLWEEKRNMGVEKIQPA